MERAKSGRRGGGGRDGVGQGNEGKRGAKREDVMEGLRGIRSRGSDRGEGKRREGKGGRAAKEGREREGMGDGIGIRVRSNKTLDIQHD